MLASIRHFFRFIDLDEEFDKYGFRHKVRLGCFQTWSFSLIDYHQQNGAVFKLNSKPEVCE